jgi:hypothetical protein
MKALTKKCRKHDERACPKKIYEQYLPLKQAYLEDVGYVKSVCEGRKA